MATLPGPTQTPTITERLADHVVGLGFDDIPGPVVAKAKDHLVHLLGAAFRGHRQDHGRRAVQVAAELSGGDGSCTIIGTGQRAHVLDAVFANALLMHSSGLDIALLPQGVNPGVVTQPVAWAVGEEGRVSGRELLAAVIVGYDVLGRLCDPAFTFGRDSYQPAKHVLEPFGAAAAAARLLGLSREQTVHALGHAGQVGRNAAGHGDQVRTMHPRWARDGAMAAVLAKAGMATSSTVVEDENGVFRTFFSEGSTDFVEAGLATLGQEFAMTEARAKRYDASLLHVIPVDLALQTMTNHGLTLGGIASVDVVLPRECQARWTKREARLSAATSDRNRSSSLRFRVAIMLVDKRTDPARFERSPDAALDALLDRIALRYEEGHPIHYARLEVTTTDGVCYVADSDRFVEPPPVDWAEWLTDEGRTHLADRQLTRLVDLIRNLEDVSDVSEVVACTVPGTPS